MQKTTSGYAYLFITVFFFSTLETVSKTMTGQINAFQSNFIRFFIGGAVLFAILLFRKEAEVKPHDLLPLLGIGVLNIVCSMNLLQLALYQPGSSAAVVAVIFSSNPIFVALFSAMIEKEKLSLVKVLSLLCGICGIITVFIPQLTGAQTGVLSPLLAAGAAVLYGLYTVLGKRLSSRIGSLKMNAYSFLMGSAAMLPCLLLMELPVFSFDPSALPKVLYLSIFVTGLAYLTYFIGLERTGASKGSLVFFLKPVLASVIAVIFLGESLTPNVIFGAVFVLLAIGLVVYGERLFPLNSKAGK